MASKVSGWTCAHVSMIHMYPLVQNSSGDTSSQPRPCHEDRQETADKGWQEQAHGQAGHTAQASWAASMRVVAVFSVVSLQFFSRVLPIVHIQEGISQDSQVFKCHRVSRNGI